MYISIGCAVFSAAVLVLAGMLLMAIILTGKEDKKDKPSDEMKGIISTEYADEYLLMYNIPQWKQDEFSKNAPKVWEKVKESIENPEDN